MKTEKAVDVLSALAHEGRLTLVRRLIKAGPSGMSAGALAKSARIGASTASAQLTVLANAGLVESTRTGRSIVYRAKYETLSGLLAYLMRDCCAGEPSICQPLAGLIR